MVVIWLALEALEERAPRSLEERPVTVAGVPWDSSLGKAILLDMEQDMQTWLVDSLAQVTMEAIRIEESRSSA